MNEEQFNAGYKHLKRFLKNEGYFNTFKKYTAHYNEKEYKEKIFNEFNGKGNTSTYSYRTWHWSDFFDWTYFVGKEYIMYGNENITVLTNKWKQYLANNDIYY